MIFFFYVVAMGFNMCQREKQITIVAVCGELRHVDKNLGN